ncbi:MAG: hypothetical protein GY699_09545 [Desulfobacteraceae bacterium]|nr:hypothetical protein [Desulfobacteraceae bacterium]
MNKAMITIACSLIVLAIASAVNSHVKVEKIEEREKNHYQEISGKVDSLNKKMDSVIMYLYTEDVKHLRRQMN